MNTLKFGEAFLRTLLQSNTMITASILNQSDTEKVVLPTNEEVTKYMSLILERLHSLYNDLIMDNFTPLNDESIRNLFHYANQSFAAFVPLFKLITQEVQKNVSATDGNIETYQAIVNEKFKEFFVIMKDMIEQSSTAYKEELIYAIHDATQFNENFVASINFALTDNGNAFVSLRNSLLALPTNEAFENLDKNTAINLYTQFNDLSNIMTNGTQGILTSVNAIIDNQEKLLHLFNISNIPGKDILQTIKEANSIINENIINGGQLVENTLTNLPSASSLRLLSFNIDKKFD
jgi:hypothetical protein